MNCSLISKVYKIIELAELIYCPKSSDILFGRVAACGLFYLIAAFNDDVAPCLEIYDLEMQGRVDILVEE